MTYTVWFDGIDDLNTLAVTLERTSGQVGHKAAAVVRANAHQVEALGKQFSPFKTGMTRNSIGADFTGDGRFATFEAQIGPTTSYAPFLEFGTSRMPPHAFMGPALDRVSPDFFAAMAQVADPLGGDSG